MNNRRQLTIEDTRRRMESGIKPTRVDTGNYYWVWGKTNTGRNYIDGPYMTENDAWQGGYQALDGDFRVIKLDTKDIRQATRVIKRMDLEETKSIEQSLRRARHEL